MSTQTRDAGIMRRDEKKGGRAVDFAVVWLVLVVVTGVVASNKGRSVGGWVLLAVLVAPITLLILLALPSLKTPVQEEILAEQRRQREATERLAAPPPAADTKTCPRCAETVKRAAAVCRFCGHEFGAPPPVAAGRTDGRFAPGSNVRHASERWGIGTVQSVGTDGMVLVRFMKGEMSVHPDYLTPV